MANEMWQCVYGNICKDARKGFVHCSPHPMRDTCPSCMTCSITRNRKFATNAQCVKVSEVLTRETAQQAGLL